MTHLLVKTFIKDYENTSSFLVREAYGRLGGIIGIVINLILCTSKISIGLLFGSVAILADGINNLSDAGSSIITLIGFKLSAKPADASHPYGHARIEYLSGLIISFIILFLGLQLIGSSFQKVLHPEPVYYNIVALLVLLFSIILKLWLFLFNRSLGKTIHSTTMLATAADSLNDVVATSGVLLAALITHATHVSLDGYVGLFVGLFVLYSGISLIKDTMNPLLGEAPDPDFVQNVQAKLRSYPSIAGFHDLVLHSYGPNRYFASVHAEVPADGNLLIYHDLIDNIERDFSTEMGINLVIHLDPIVTDDEKSCEIKAELLEIIHNISPELTIHDFRLVAGHTHTNILFDIAVPIGFKESPESLAAIIDQEMKKIDETYFTIITVDTNYIATSISSS